MELWESVALTLAENAKINAARHELLKVNDKPVLLSMRFDRTPGFRVPFLSAMSMLGLKDGDRASYPEIADALAGHGASADRDRTELYRRMVFNVLVSNVDDHLRNHGFLWVSRAGWSLSPAYDVNPTPTDVRRRILTTNIDLDEGTCSLELVQSAAGYFGLKLPNARAIIREVAASVRHWRETAAARALERPRFSAWKAHLNMRICARRWQSEWQAILQKKTETQILSSSAASRPHFGFAASSAASRLVLRLTAIKAENAQRHHAYPRWHGARVGRLRRWSAGRG